MGSIGNSLDYVKIIKNKNVITILETYSVQSYSGHGYSTQAALETTTNVVVHYKSNLQIAIQNDKIILKSSVGASHTFQFKVLETEGVKKSETALEFAQNLLA